MTEYGYIDRKMTVLVPIPEGVRRASEIFCGCGAPWLCWGWIRDTFRRMKIEAERFDRGNSYTVLDPPDFAVLRYTSGPELIVFYLLDHLDLTDHGGSVPGWLTPDGLEVLEFLEEHPSFEGVHAWDDSQVPTK